MSKSPILFWNFFGHPMQNIGKIFLLSHHHWSSNPLYIWHNETEGILEQIIVSVRTCIGTIY